MCVDRGGHSAELSIVAWDTAYICLTLCCIPYLYISYLMRQVTADSKYSEYSYPVTVNDRMTVNQTKRDIVATGDW